MVCIVKIKHRALRRFWRSAGSERRGIPSEQAGRLARILSRLNMAERPADLTDPGFRLHPLTGDLAGYWSIRVTHNWRVVFRFEEDEAVDIDFMDYH